VPNPGVGKYIKVLDASAKIFFNTTQYTAGTIYIGPGIPLATISSGFAASLFTKIQTANKFTDCEYLSNAPLYAYTPGPMTLGDSALRFYITYQIIDE